MGFREGMFSQKNYLARVCLGKKYRVHAHIYAIQEGLGEGKTGATHIIVDWGTRQTKYSRSSAKNTAVRVHICCPGSSVSRKVGVFIQGKKNSMMEVTYDFCPWPET
jgi:hypothetical protein